MRLTDIHNHVLYDIDDGAESINQSVQMLKKAKTCGVAELCLTPHLFLTRPLDISEIQQKTQTLQKNFKDIKLHYGCELMMENNIPEFIENNPDFCLGNSKYVLIELPMFNYPTYIREVLYNLKIKGFNPIIAHPERNLIIQKKSSDYFCEDILENGHIQVNAGSITGKYGKKIKQTALRLIKNNLVSFVASDSHRPDHYDNFHKAYLIISKRFSQDIANQLFDKNPNKILNREDLENIEINQIQTKKKSKFIKLFYKRRSIVT